MLRTVQSLPLTGLSTLGSGPARFQTTPPACYRASWQLPGPDSHRQATTSLRTRRTPWHYVTVSPPALLGARKDRARCSSHDAPPACRPPTGWASAPTWSRQLPGPVVEELADGLEQTYRRYLGQGSSSPGAMLRSRRAVTGIAMQGLRGTRRSPSGEGQRATALGVRVIASRSPGRHRKASVIPRLVTLPEGSTRPMPYPMEVSLGSRGRWLSGTGRGATGAPLAVGSARALMICWA